jgi:hypothetical protein
VTRYSKFIAAAIGAAITICTTAFASASWEPPVAAALTTAAVYFVPNKPKGTP